MTRVALGAGVLVASWLLVGCTNGPVSIDQVAEDIGCETSDDVTPVIDSSVETESAACELDGSLVSIYTFDSNADRDTWLHVSAHLADRAVNEEVVASPQALVYGERWAVLCEDRQAHNIADDAGGEVR